MEFFYFVILFTFALAGIVIQFSQILIRMLAAIAEMNRGLHKSMNKLIEINGNGGGEYFVTKLLEENVPPALVEKEKEVVNTSSKELVIENIDTETDNEAENKPTDKSVELEEKAKAILKETLESTDKNKTKKQQVDGKGRPFFSADEILKSVK